MLFKDKMEKVPATRFWPGVDIFQACRRLEAGRIWRTTCARRATFVLQMCSGTARAWWNSSGGRTWSTRYADWTGPSSVRIRWVGTSDATRLVLDAGAETSICCLKGETAFIRVFEERGTPNWGRSRSRSRSRGRYSPPFHNRRSPPPPPPPRYQSPPRHAMPRHSPPLRRPPPQSYSPPPRHYR